MPFGITEWLTQAHVAELMGVSTKAVEYAIAHGEIQHRSHHGHRAERRPRLGARMG